VLAGIDVLTKAGATVKEVTIPHAALAKEANSITMMAEAFAYHRPDITTKWSTYGKFTRMTLGRGALYAAPDYTQAQRFRSYFKKAVAAVMADIDLLVTPTSITPAEKSAEMDMQKRMLGPSYTGVWNLTGQPALALPCGFSSQMLPLSMQIVGKPFAEATVLKAGDAYQRLTDWHLRVPPIMEAVGSRQSAVVG
jgi:aspartyl-tRNA(Asn)/glutamyl-tRNA(Gln) amidotransferase subunit A